MRPAQHDEAQRVDGDPILLATLERPLLGEDFRQDRTIGRSRVDPHRAPAASLMVLGSRSTPRRAREAVRGSPSPRAAAQLLLRSYAQADDDQARGEILDLIDGYLERAAYGFADAVGQAER